MNPDQLMQQLALPAQDPAWQPGVDLRPAALREWLAQQPTLNVAAVTEALRRVLLDVHRTVLGPGARYEALVALMVTLDHVTAGIRQQLTHVTFPLAPAKLQLYERLQGLLSAAADGYKMVVVDLLRDNAAGGSDQELQRDALLRAVQCLGQQVVHACAAYRHPPSAVWRDLNLFYAYSEKRNVHRTRVEHLADQSIGGVYLQICLLSLATPSHLLLGEVHQVYEALQKWSLAAQLRHPDELSSATLTDLIMGRFFVDLASQDPPRFGYEGYSGSAQVPRLIEVKELVRIVSERVKQLTVKADLTMAERLERDLMRRLRNAWSQRPERKSERAPISCTVGAASGLGACHHLISGEAAFEPEQSEIALHGGSFQHRQTLSLVPLDYEQWKEKDTREKLDKGILKPRGFGFDMEAKDQDVWKKAHLVSRLEQTHLERTAHDRLHSVVRLDCRDRSDGGLGLDCPKEVRIHARVGELLALSRGDKGWILAVVRWLLTAADEELQIGLSRITDCAEPVAVRGLAGRGGDRPYLKALMVPEGAGSSIIVTTGAFDKDSKILVNRGQRLAVGRLGRVLETNKTFTQFVIEESSLTEEQTEQAVQGLYTLLGDMVG
jgi:hypothetical protein